MMLADDPADVVWNFNDDFFSGFDWKTEPEESIERLYEKRANHIRERYDYVILMLSGGSDSMNIFETFIRNNIKLDEVCYIVNVAGTNTRNSLLNREIFDVAQPAVARASQLYNITIKERMYDITSSTIEFYNNNPDFIHHLNNSGSPLTQAKPRGGSLIDTHVIEWINMVERGKRICFLWGCDKPRVIGRGDKFSFYFSDIVDIVAPIKNQVHNIQGEAVDELFYWSPTKESAYILIKQAHIIKRIIINLKNCGKLKLIERINMVRNPFRTEYISSYQDPVSLKFYRINSCIIKNSIYPHHSIVSDLYSSKNNNNFLNERDSWFWKTNESILGGLEHHANTVKSGWVQDAYMMFNDKKYIQKIKKLCSKEYPLQ